MISRHSPESDPRPTLRLDLPMVVFTGAEDSAESGLPTFRGKDGLWEGRSVYEVAAPEGYGVDPRVSHRFYNQRRAKLLELEPNVAHLALARLEQNLSLREGIHRTGLAAWFTDMLATSWYFRKIARKDWGL